MFGARRAPNSCNFVHNDQIWKDHVHKELFTARKWPGQWGFLKEMYTQANNCHFPDQDGNRNLPPQESLKLPPIHHKTSLINPPLNDQQHRSVHPLTTAGIIGWRYNTNLEHYGRHARGKVRIEKLLKQPRLSILHRLTN